MRPAETGRLSLIAIEAPVRTADWCNIFEQRSRIGHYAAMPVERSSSEAPIYADPDYKQKYEQACLAQERDGREWFLGRGIHQSRHPIGHLFGELECEACKIDYATVVAASVLGSPRAEKGELICEFRCDGCGRYNQVVAKD